MTDIATNDYTADAAKRIAEDLALLKCGGAVEVAVVGQNTNSVVVSITIDMESAAATELMRACGRTMPTTQGE